MWYLIGGVYGGIAVISFFCMVSVEAVAPVRVSSNILKCAFWSALWPVWWLIFVLLVTKKF